MSLPRAAPCERRAAPIEHAAADAYLARANVPHPPLERKAFPVIEGVGIDMVRIERVWEALRRHGDRALRRFFTAAEAERCRGSRHPPESFAARFAAKEAFFKALGTGWGRGGDWTDVEVVSAESGAPTVNVYGRAAELCAARGIRRIHVSLTHTGDTAAAVVVLES
jgi:holo-[acyl-carrier protein] synthase